MFLNCFFIFDVLLFALAQDSPKNEINAKESILETLFGDDNIKFFFYNRKRMDNPENIKIKINKKSFNEDFDFSKTTKMIIHGWMGSEDSTYSRIFREELLKKMDVNLIVVDWSGYGSQNIIYPLAKDKVPEVARVVAVFLDVLNKRRFLRIERLHVLGHSLGAHIAGIAGNLVKSGKIGRITGFDPAAPLFDTDIKNETLSLTSARLVDVIHTCGGFLGLESRLGHVDFYPNGGKHVQPGCGNDLSGICSHTRSYHLYLESISNRKAFPAVSCPCWEDFRKMENCTSTDVYMGEGLHPKTRGQFFLATFEKSPFGLGHL